MAVRARPGHAGWEDGNTSQAGFTTAWPPNRVTPGQFGGISVPDTDLIAIREENGGPTFAAVTARSSHPGGVNVLMGDLPTIYYKRQVMRADRAPYGTSPLVTARPA